MSLPRELEEFSITPSACHPGVQFACDILCRAQQRILLIHDCSSSFTATRLIPNEQAISLRAAIIEAIAELKDASGCIIRVDGASAFSSLGRIKNKNKNPIAEKAIQELEKELKRAYPEGGPITPPQLALVTAMLNIRVRGLAAKEILFQRDSYTGDQLNISDKALADSQFANRQANHLYSARSKAPNARPGAKANVKVGDLVFVKQDGNKHTTREKYLVTALNQDRLWARKLTGSQFRAKTYELKYCDVYLVPTSQVLLCPNKSSDPYASDTSSDDVSIPLTTDPTHSDFGDSSEVSMSAGTNAQPSTSGSNYPACNEHVDTTESTNTMPVVSSQGSLTPDVRTPRTRRHRHPPEYLNDYILS